MEQPTDENVNENVQPAQDSLRIKQGAIFLGLVALVIVLLYVMGFVLKSSVPLTPIENVQAGNAVDLAASGKFSEALVEAERINAESQGTNAVARSVIDTSKFLTGDSQSRIEAVRYTKESYAAYTGNGLNQALQVNKLLGYLNSGFEQYVFDEVFSGEQFSQFIVPGDKASSIRKLAEHSIELYPTTSALFRIGQWDADRIRDLYGEWNATEAQKMTYANDILRIIAEADALIASETQQIDGRPFDFMVEPRYLYWKSYLYGVVARVRPEYIQESKNALVALEQVFETSRDENGNKIPLISTRLPYGYYSYALTLHEVKGSEAKAEIQQTLDALVTLVESNPGIHEGSYLSFIREFASRSRENQERYYKGYLELAEVHPPFKEFLQEHGVKL